MKSLLRMSLLWGIVICGVWVFIAQPRCSRNEVTPITFDPERLQAHVKTLSVDFHPRNYRHVEHLNQTAQYIAQHFKSAGCQVELQEYKVGEESYQNVIGRLGASDAPKLILGAHYDSHELTPGADDNASGVAGLIELAYLLGSASLEIEVELVAYTLEEPPHFRSDNMGSAVHAKSVQVDKERIIGVIVLEMIGYFSDEEGSQTYPSPVFKLIYPNKGNFIAVVGNLDQNDFTLQVKTLMQGTTDLEVYSINAPEQLPGVDFSDHASYWPYGINAIMITDTAFYRNFEYHKSGDTYDRLDYRSMHNTVIALYETVLALNKE